MDMPYRCPFPIIARDWLKRHGTNDKCHDRVVISGGALVKKGVFGQALDTRPFLTPPGKPRPRPLPAVMSLASVKVGPNRCFVPPSTGPSPTKGFADLDEARAWAAGFVHWYNDNVDHRHSSIRYVSPTQRHAGEDQTILAARHALYTEARELNPARWSGNTRSWAAVGPVTLNPERHSVIKAHSVQNNIQPLAA